jgi:molybdopterin converting factor small subunit
MTDKIESTLSVEPTEAAPGNGNAQPWELHGLKPTPEEEWERLRGFLGFGSADIQAMLETVEPLFRRGHELVVRNYEYLLENHETAAILGWERGPDPAHLAERRRFFTIWLARSLGLDLSHDFARYLYRAGQYHAGHGPRRIHVPDVYVTGAISLVNGTFARFLAEEMPAAAVVPAALAGWNKYFSLHLHMMLLGYQAALDLERGDFDVRMTFFGRLRKYTRDGVLNMRLAHSERVEAALCKLFNYVPALREEIFDPAWAERERIDSTGAPWLTVRRAYRVKPGWRVLVNGRIIDYSGGLQVEVNPGTEIQVFPPGR